MSEKLAVEIFKQFDFEINMCEKCPRKKEKERTCIGCLENAKESLLNYIEQLQKENEKLKETLKGTTHCYDEEEHRRLQKENKELKKLNKIIYIDRSKAILNELDQWLVENYQLNIPEVAINSPVKKVYDKLQELKGRK